MSYEPGSSGDLLLLLLLVGGAVAVVSVLLGCRAIYRRITRRSAF